MRRRPHRAAQITFSNGRRRYFKFSSIDLNPLAASDIAKDKDFSTFFMNNMGYSTIKGQTFFVDDWDATIGSERTKDKAWEYAQELGLPVFVKPNSGSQGRAVAEVTNESEFFRAIDEVFKIDRVALVQTPIRGRDYRIVVLDKRVISAYERIPLNVIGNGTNTIDQLIDIKQAAFEARDRDTVINKQDPRIAETLKHKELTFDTIPTVGQQVFLLSNANLSTGGDAVDVTQHLHASIAELAINLTRDMGLRMCGVDLMLPGSATDQLSSYSIIEINAAPGLDHYVNIGEEQLNLIEDLYLDLLRSMEKTEVF